MNIEQDLMNVLLKVLSEKINPKILKKVNTYSLRKKLWKELNTEFFYKLLKEKKINLYSGFGTLLIKKVREKEKKVFDRKKKEMVVKNIKKSKIIFRPGDILKEFL